MLPLSTTRDAFAARPRTLWTIAVEGEDGRGVAVPASPNRRRSSHATSGEGRPPEQRAELAQTLIDTCVEALGLRSDRLVVEFTQHTSDEMYRAGRGWGTEWTPAEATGAA